MLLTHVLIFSAYLLRKIQLNLKFPMDVKVNVETTGKSLDERFSELVSPQPPRRRRHRRRQSQGRIAAAQGEGQHNSGTQTVEGAHQGEGNVERGTQTWLK